MSYLLCTQRDSVFLDCRMLCQFHAKQNPYASAQFLQIIKDRLERICNFSQVAHIVGGKVWANPQFCFSRVCSISMWLLNFYFFLK